jgi:TonB family protein
MKPSNHKENPLFTPSGCLSRESLENMALGTLQGEDLKLVESHLAICDFCADSFEGSKAWLKQKENGQNQPSVPTSKEASISTSLIRKHSTFGERINGINERVHARTEFHAQIGHVRKERKLRSPYYGMVAVAASIILFFGIYYIVKLRPDLRHPSVAMEKIIPDESVPATITDSIYPSLQESLEVTPIPGNEKRESPIPLRELSRDKSVVTVTDNDDLIITENIPSVNNPPLDTSPANNVAADEVVVVAYKVPAAGSNNKDSQPVLKENLNNQPGVIAGVESKRSQKSNITRESEMAEEAAVFTVVEQMPEFQGGEQKLLEFLSSHMQYPDAARTGGIQGKVYVSFVVNEIGKISDVKILRGIGGGCDEEALRVVKLMPPWTPGKQQGKAVKTMFNLPIDFKLNKQ